MPKNEDAKAARRLEELLEVVLPNVEDLSDSEVDELLSGDDDLLRRTRAALRATAGEVAATYRRKGQPAPRALMAFESAMDDSRPLPGDSEGAISKALGFVRGLAQKFAMPGEQLQILEAYRKGDKDLSANDRKILDDAASQLRRRIEKGDDQG